MPQLISKKAMSRHIAHMDGVHDAVGDAARQVARSAQGRLAIHRKTGQAKVTLTEGDVDWFVNLDDPNAMSIEFGHFLRDDFNIEVEHVEGLYIITGAAGLLK